MCRRYFSKWSLILVVLISTLSSCNRRTDPPDQDSKISFGTSDGIDGEWDYIGIGKGEKAPDFTLFSQNRERFKLYDELRKGKPIVLFNGSYTCDVSRSNLTAMKDMAEKYKDKASFYVVYTIEPHPADTVSPYSETGEVWIARNNVRDSVDADQPKTYGERVALSERWRDEYEIDATILIDNPDNVYWTTFGQAPNMAYVIDPDATVEFKQAWFNEEKFDAYMAE